MPNVLILYASTHGHTRKVASCIAATLERDGATVDLHDAGAGGTEPAALDYDAVIVGGSIHVGHHQRVVVEWAERNRTGLDMRPSAFFSVCLGAADDTEESRAATRGYVDDFVEQTGWTPERSVTFAGALQYLEYDFATRLLVRLLMRTQGRPTDASHDYDFTDWDAVEQFAHACATSLTAPQARD